MALFPEDTNNFDYEGNGYWCYNNITAGEVTGARICIKQNRAIAVSLEHGNTLGKCANSLSSCYSVAVKARSLYAGALGQTSLFQLKQWLGRSGYMQHLRR